VNVRRSGKSNHCRLPRLRVNSVEKEIVGTRRVESDMGGGTFG